DGLESESFAFVGGIQKFFYNPPLYIKQQTVNFAKTDVALIDGTLNSAGEFISFAHEKTFAFLSDSIGGASYVVSYAGNTKENLLAAAVTTNTNPVDAVSRFVYTTVNTIFESAIYKPIASLLGAEP